MANSAEPKQARPPKSIARWVAGVVGVCSGGATIYGLFADKRVAVLAFIGMVFAIVLLLVVRRGIRAVGAKNAKFYDFVVKALILFVVLYFIALTAALFPFLLKWLTADSGPKPEPVPPSPRPIVEAATPTPGPSPSATDQTFATLADACKAPAQECTVFVFDYLHDKIEGDELQAFQNIQTDRLDKGIRAHLQTFDLLKGINFRVARCSAATIKERSLADRAIKTLKVPAIMWGFIKKLPDNNLVSTTTITLGDDRLRHLGSREEFGTDITRLLDLKSPIKGNPLAIASLIVGDVHFKAGKPEFARKAFLHAQELAVDLDENDRKDFLTTLSSRLQLLDAERTAPNLQPIGASYP